MNIHLVSLGCARNTVDSEMMTGRLTDAGYRMTSDPALAETIIVNTCSFIKDAADESIDTILELARYKSQGVCRCLVVAGCLPQRYGADIADSLPEVDAFVGTGAFDDIVSAVASCGENRQCLLPDPDRAPLFNPRAPRVVGTGVAAYLKIAEGCSRHCTYCIIPKLRGIQKSRKRENIVMEARGLITAGIRELTLVAQDTTAWGRDLTPPDSLDRLVKDLAGLSGDVWFRLLYGHPESIDEKAIRAVGGAKNVCSYFDIPIQHASAGILKAMGRGGDANVLKKLFDDIRSMVPDAVLRTTVIVGFPGETDADFNTLLSFARSVRFDHLGVFCYSDSEDLPSHGLPGHVPEKTALKRRDELMALQRSISEQNNEKHLGRTVRVLLEEEAEKGIFIGRTAFQAPEVDGITYVYTQSAAVGDFINARITDTMEYDLVGETL